MWARHKRNELRMFSILFNFMFFSNQIRCIDLNIVSIDVFYWIRSLIFPFPMNNIRWNYWAPEVNLSTTDLFRYLQSPLFGNSIFSVKILFLILTWIFGFQSASAQSRNTTNLLFFEHWCKHFSRFKLCHIENIFIFIC